MRSLRVWAPGPDRKEQKSGWWRGGQAGLHPLAWRHRVHKLGPGGFEEENCLDEVTLSETVTRFEENVRFRKSHSGPRSLPNWDLREPSEKRLPPREKLPQLGKVVRRRRALGPPWCRPGPGLSGPVGARSAAAAPHGERRQPLPWRAEHEGRVPARGGRYIRAGGRGRKQVGGRGSHAAPRGGRGQRPGRARRTAGCGPDPGLRPTRVPARPRP